MAAAIGAELVARARFLDAQRPFAPNITDLQASQVQAIVGVIRSAGQLTVDEATVVSEAVQLGIWSAAEKVVIGAAIADQLTAKTAVVKHTRGQQYCPRFEEFITEGIVETLQSARASESEKVDTVACFAKLLGITCPSEILQLRIAAVVAIVGLGKTAMDAQSKYVLKGKVRAQIKWYDAASPHPFEHMTMIKAPLTANRHAYAYADVEPISSERVAELFPYIENFCSRGCNTGLRTSHASIATRGETAGSALAVRGSPLLLDVGPPRGAAPDMAQLMAMMSQSIVQALVPMMSGSAARSHVAAPEPADAEPTPLDIAFAPRLRLASRIDPGTPPQTAPTSPQPPPVTPPRTDTQCDLRMLEDSMLASIRHKKSSDTEHATRAAAAAVATPITVAPPLPHRRLTQKIGDSSYDPKAAPLAIVTAPKAMPKAKAKTAPKAKHHEAAPPVVIDDVTLLKFGISYAAFLDADTANASTRGAFTSRAYDNTKRKAERAFGKDDPRTPYAAKAAYSAAARFWDAQHE
jgi:hypothetical protein